ncbi:uncharacterized protein MONBRDRAFT_28404 [Monosiga brevicollis MX1]|uniref:C2H2-type domain-containing protein n=1 Tax=Monosiga brevicollis TaxID=81824 RepID=A9V829_MONBE|nr:uncharacterized protein MONBRDRAFT_28404 [Monosiga brevicollis MX1]EDQ86197.1 predicted protein [Monosiga brevicollis MX1]|eukprot:XP_001748867.1 hypothetical protein [Monosiga brevicollis MX1]
MNMAASAMDPSNATTTTTTTTVALGSDPSAPSSKRAKRSPSHHNLQGDDDAELEVLSQTQTQGQGQTQTQGQNKDDRATTPHSAIHTSATTPSTDQDDEDDHADDQRHTHQGNVAPSNSHSHNPNPQAGPEVDEDDEELDEDDEDDDDLDGYKVHHCPVCRATFTRAAHLKRHANVHRDRDTRRYRCPLPHCNHAVYRSDHMRQHLRRRHRITDKHILAKFVRQSDGTDLPIPTHPHPVTAALTSSSAGTANGATHHIKPSRRRTNNVATPTATAHLDQATSSRLQALLDASALDAAEASSSAAAAAAAPRPHKHAAPAAQPDASTNSQNGPMNPSPEPATVARPHSHGSGPSTPGSDNGAAPDFDPAKPAHNLVAAFQQQQQQQQQLANSQQMMINSAQALSAIQALFTSAQFLPCMLGADGVMWVPIVNMRDPSAVTPGPGSNTNANPPAGTA